MLKMADGFRACPKQTPPLSRHPNEWSERVAPWLKVCLVVLVMPFIVIKTVGERWLLIPITKSEVFLYASQQKPSSTFLSNHKNNLLRLILSLRRIGYFERGIVTLLRVEEVLLL